MSETIQQSFERATDPSRAQCPNRKRRGELVAIAKTLLPWKPNRTHIEGNFTDCKAEIARRATAAEQEKIRADNIARGLAFAARIKTPAPLPPKSRKEIAAELWAHAETIKDPLEKRRFYLANQSRMD